MEDMCGVPSPPRPPPPHPKKKKKKKKGEMYIKHNTKSKSTPSPQDNTFIISLPHSSEHILLKVVWIAQEPVRYMYILCEN